MNIHDGGYLNYLKTGERRWMTSVDVTLVNLYNVYSLMKRNRYSVHAAVPNSRTIQLAINLI